MSPDSDGLRRLCERVTGQRVRAVIESMTGARHIHDTLEELGWEVLVADAHKVKGLAPLACKTDRIDARVLAELSWRERVSDVLCVRPGRLVAWSVGQSVSEVDLQASEGAGPVVGAFPGAFGAEDG